MFFLGLTLISEAKNNKKIREVSYRTAKPGTIEPLK
jgi:hypothetical protein